jgi:hypothetical protein
MLRSHMCFANKSIFRLFPSIQKKLCLSASLKKSTTKKCCLRPYNTPSSDTDCEAVNKRSMQASIESSPPITNHLPIALSKGRGTSLYVWHSSSLWARRLGRPGGRDLHITTDTLSFTRGGRVTNETPAQIARWLVCVRRESVTGNRGRVTAASVIRVTARNLVAVCIGRGSCCFVPVLPPRSIDRGHVKLWKMI